LLTSKLYYVAQIFYALIQNIAKFSILFLYLRIFPTPRFRQAVKLSMIVIVCHTIAFTLGVGMQCFPLDSLWDATIPAKCIDIHIFAIWGAALSIFYDIVIMLLPISELKGLNLTLRKRVALCFMFALGSLYVCLLTPSITTDANMNSACITSMVRLKYLKDFYPTIDGSCWSPFFESTPLLGHDLR
jgi:Fungal rhodopsin domain